jgi:hypothetical protein
MAYKLISTKGTREVEGTQADAIAAAIAMEADLQPAYGVTVEIDGETVAEIRDGVDVYADEDDVDSDLASRDERDPEIQDQLNELADADMEALYREQMP